MIKVTKALTMKHRKKREVITSFRKKMFFFKGDTYSFLNSQGVGRALTAKSDIFNFQTCCSPL